MFGLWSSFVHRRSDGGEGMRCLPICSHKDQKVFILCSWRFFITWAVKKFTVYLLLLFLNIIKQMVEILVLVEAILERGYFENFIMTTLVMGLYSTVWFTDCMGVCSLL